MVTENSTQNKFKVSFQGDFGSGTHWLGYTGSKSMIRVQRLDSQKVSLVTILGQPNPNKTISFYTDPSGVLEIPLRIGRCIYLFIERDLYLASIIVISDCYPP